MKKCQVIEGGGRAGPGIRRDNFHTALLGCCSCCVYGRAGTMDAFLFARVAVATEEELVYWLDNADADQSPELPINSVNELKALEFVAAECARRLQRYVRMAAVVVQRCFCHFYLRSSSSVAVCCCQQSRAIG